MTDAAPDARLARLREEYADTGLDESAAGDDPFALFDRWLDEVIEAGLPEPNAMALATATAHGVPSSRIVLLKGLDARGAVFYTNYGSRKGAELDANPVAAATMLWHPLQRQVRLEGPVVRVAPEESDAYFASRPRGSRLGALASPQSQPVADRAALDAAYAEADRAHLGDVARPEGWGGYRLVPDAVEFWQGRRSRMHDRIRFDRADGGWTRVRLAP